MGLALIQQAYPHVLFSYKLNSLAVPDFLLYQFSFAGAPWDGSWIITWPSINWWLIWLLFIQVNGNTWEILKSSVEKKGIAILWCCCANSALNFRTEVHKTGGTGLCDVVLHLPLFWCHGDEACVNATFSITTYLQAMVCSAFTSHAEHRFA